ncbi:tRNA (adenine(58)-N(1))-methyltransferase catalytic subunit TRMT61A [Chionoecetes opilio]|uniref:tRNA (adenine(58)-N(1))-methyltransferase catalytic subunit TRMT61A n=1 Tax=Chionoecetes opilio TaxID=41210 RepID=A0A8J4XNE6_CHIOP|nr:tRNA (adenine(58)-N(1))-methyltransferase catalytic subunit TRMT61A [Chionoecetes opilio]
MIKPKIINRNGQEVPNVFQTKYGSVRVMDLVGVKYGSRVSLSKGWGHVLYPTPELWTVTLPHRTQILYTPDIAMVVMQLELGPGSVVCEAGTGSGSLSHAILRAIGATGKLHTFDFHKERVKVASEEFTRHGLGERVVALQRDVCDEGFGVEGVADAVFLDLPKPWDALPHAVAAIKTSGGRICSFSPCIEQVSRTSEVLESLGVQELLTLECLAREFQVKTISLPTIINGQKAPTQQNTQVNQEETQPHMKKMKVEEECVGGGGDTNTKADEQITAGNKGQKGNGDFKFTTGITQLKMPGHTGFLTFASVPPGLARNKIACLV